jgi:hypothetical protein
MTRKRPSDEAAQEPNRVPGEAAIIPLPENFLAHIHTGAAIADIEGVKWLLKGRIPMGGLIALYAPPKSGKSVVAVELAVAASLGEAFWQVQFERPMTVLYMAAERTADIADRMKAALQRRGVPYPDTLHLYARPAGPLQVTSGTHLQALKQVAEHLKPDLIIFDTFARMTLGIQENDTGEMGEAVEEFNAVLRAAGPQCAGMIVHHEGKNKDMKLRGSTALLGAVDGSWRVHREGNNYTLDLDALNAGALPPPEHFTIQGEQLPGNELTTAVLVWQAFGEYASAKNKWLMDTLTAAGDKGLSKQEVTDLFNEHHATNKAAATIYGWLTKLVAKGEVEQPPGPKSRARYYAKGYAPQ